MQPILDESELMRRAMRDPAARAWQFPTAYL
jgi:hypothetical protein